jgi:NADH-quinone oxidoreductase subunit J
MGIYWPTFFFLLFALVACGFALAVVLTRNIVRMAFYLTLSLGATSGLFFLVGADFVGAMQLLIYVGGTLVLLIFGVMLTAQGPFISMRTAGGDWILAALVALPLLGILVQSAFSFKVWQPRSRAEAEATVAQPTSSPLGLGLLGARVDQLEQPDVQLKKGMSGYLLPFEIISVHLLVVLIGAAYLARAKRR